MEHRLGQQLLNLRVLVLERLQPFGIGYFHPAAFGIPRVKVSLLIPCLRHASAVFAPTSCFRHFLMICSSVTRLRFMSIPFRRYGLYTIFGRSLRGSGQLNFSHARNPIPSDSHLQAAPNKFGNEFAQVEVLFLIRCDSQIASLASRRPPCLSSSLSGSGRPRKNSNQPEVTVTKNYAWPSRAQHLMGIGLSGTLADASSGEESTSD